MGKKKCELCEGVARMYCESDQASLCWRCDCNVHGANFLVAKHTRCLLCSACQSPTPWKASGLSLSPTISICESCLARRNLTLEIKDRDFEDGAESYDDTEDDEESEEEAENQVVPWDVAAAKQPPAVSSSSSVSSSNGSLVGKRTRQHSELNWSDDEESNESQPLKRSRNLVKIDGYDHLNHEEITRKEKIKRL